MAVAPSETTKSLPEYQQMDQTALDQIRLHVSEYYFQILEEFDSARSAYSKLKDHFEGSSLVKGIKNVNELITLANGKLDNLDDIVVKSD